MNIIILNGSPKGEKSVTMQYVKYLEASYTEHAFTYIHVARYAKKFESNVEFRKEILDTIGKADIILWAFPLYYLLVNSEYKRFIEYIYENDLQAFFKDKHCGILTTSIHYFDHTAVEYMRQVSHDFGMNCVDDYTAEMHDLKKPEYQESLKEFIATLIDYKEKDIPCKSFYPQLPVYSDTFKAPHNVIQSDSTAKVTIVADIDREGSAIDSMVTYMEDRFQQVTLFNIRNIKMGHCVGCLKCGFDGECMYEGKDDFIGVHRKMIEESDIIIFALHMKDRYMSHYWQRYMERGFYRNHQPIYKGKQIVYMISGPLSYNGNAKEILTAYVEVGGGNLVGFVTDESQNSQEICKRMDALADGALRNVNKNIMKPMSFLGVGGMKIFRDDIYSGLKFVFQKDYAYYKKHKLFDFPQNKPFFNFKINMLTLLTKIGPIRRMIQNTITDKMLDPYQPVLKKVKQV